MQRQDMVTTTMAKEGEEAKPRREKGVRMKRTVLSRTVEE
jgi:hypothetical protein